MQTFRKRLALAFEAWAVFVSRHDRWVLLATASIVVAFATQLPKLRIDTDIESFLYEDDPAMVSYNNFRDQFGRDDRIVIGIATEEVFDLPFLTRLRDLHRAIEEEIPHLEEVESLITARNVYGTEDELVVEDLFEEWPENAEDLARLRATALGNPLYVNFLISANSDFTNIAIKVRRYGETLSDDEALEQFEFDVSASGDAASGDSASGDSADGDFLPDDTPFGDTGVTPSPAEPALLTDEQNQEVIVSLQELLARFDAPDFRIYAAGQPVLTYTIERTLVSDMQFFVVVGIAVIAVLLFLLFHTVTAVVPPLIVVVCALLSTLSLMAITGIPMQVPTQILPSFLLAVGIAGSVHLLTIFHHELHNGEEKPEALRLAMGHAAQPILFTSLTTAGGLFSFVGSDMAPVSNLGLFAPVGVLLAFFYTTTMLPALISILPSPEAHESRQFRLAGEILERLGAFSLRRPGPIIAVTALLVIVGGYMTSQIYFSHNPLNWLPDDAPLKEATITIDRKMAGTMSMEILVDSGTPGAFKEPERLRAMDAMSREIEALDTHRVRARQTISILDLLKEIHQALNENRESYYGLADTRELVSQELLLFENSGADDLEDLVDSTYARARMTLLVNWFDALEYVRFVDDAQAIAEKHFDRSEITITGLMPILTNTLLILIRSISTSYVLALLIIVPLMMLMVASVKTGSLAMAPNIIPILLCLGVMGAFGIPFDGFTMMIGGVAIGLVVDDTIHFLHHFKRYLDETGSVDEAVMRTLHTTGRAMLFTTIVLVCGFGAFTLSSMHNLTNFGMLTGLAVALALLADILLMPALVRLIYGNDNAAQGGGKENAT